jgi:Mobilization protein NikA
MPRIQVVLSEEERERFRGQARREGLSLSAWLRAAGRERLVNACERPGMKTTEDLDAFFQRCDAREKGGSEPDWEEHLKVIESSRSSSASDS